MAIIGSIRKRSGLLVIIIGVALAAFVLGDFLKPGKRFKQTNNIGVVGGENIPYNEFVQKVEEQLANIKQRAKKENLSAVFRNPAQKIPGGDHVFLCNPV